MSKQVEVIGLSADAREWINYLYDRFTVTVKEDRISQVIEGVSYPLSSWEIQIDNTRYKWSEIHQKNFILGDKTYVLHCLIMATWKIKPKVLLAANGRRFSWTHNDLLFVPVNQQLGHYNTNPNLLKHTV